MQKTRAELSLILVFLLGCFATSAAASALGAQHARHCGLADASSLLQQHGAAAVTTRLPSSAWSNTSSLAAFLEDLRKEAETRSLENAMRLYESGQRLAELSEVSTEEKGLMLLQEATRIFDPPFYQKAVDKVQEQMTRLKKWSKKSQMSSCYGSYVNIPLNLVGALFSIFVTVTCDSVGTCTSEGLETLRYLLVAMQHVEGKKSYCAETFKMDYLCKAAAYEVGSNVAGLGSAITGVTYKCPEYTVDSSKKVVGLKVTDIQCNLGYAKGAIYLGLAVSKIAEIYLGWGENTGNKDVSQQQGPITFYTGQPYTAFFSQLGATVSWIAQLVLLMVGNCKGSAGKMACGGEIAELVAFVAQTITGAFMVNSYCLDPDNRKAVLERATDTKDFDDEDSVNKLKKKKSIPLTQHTSIDTIGNSDDHTKSRRSVIIDPQLSEHFGGVDGTASNKDDVDLNSVP